MKPVWLTGIAIWSPGYASARAFAAGLADPSVTDCDNPWVPSRLGRGSSRLTRMLGEVAARACAHAGADPKFVATVYGSGYGEIETMLALLETIFAGDGQLSPMRFKNSVHNAASGLCAIGTGNTGFSTAIAAGDRSFEASMIEALLLLGERGGEVVVSVADDALPEPLARQCARQPLAVGLCLSSERPGSGAIASLGDLRRREEAVPLRTSFVDRRLDPALATNPAAHALPLLEAAIRKRPGSVPLAMGAPRPFSLELRPDVRDALAPS